MKKLVCVAAVALCALISCKNKNADVSEVKFAPPVVSADKEVREAAPVTDINIDGPVGSSDKANESGYNNSTITHTVADTAKKIIKNGTIVFETNNLAATRKKILASVKKYGGYVDNDSETLDGDSNRREYNLKIRVPAANFDFILDTVSSTAYKIDSRNISVTDVTTQYIDIKTRLDNKKALEKRYLELLAKAAKISDMLEIENKLADIRSDIESTQGQLNYLSKQVAYSSLDITFYTSQPAQVNSGDGTGYKFKTALGNGWQMLQNMFFGLIGLWPVILIIGVLYWLLNRWRKRRRAKKIQSNS